MAATATQSKKIKRERRHRRIRSKVHGTAERPRFVVFRSNKFMYAQLIDDDAKQTLAAASDMKASAQEGVETVGTTLALAAKGKNISKVVFDRGGYIFTGRVKAVAEAARKGGLEF